MKCPLCSEKTKYSSGVTCKCGYRFALDPSQEPRISDKAMHSVVSKLSSDGKRLFTYNQLYAALHKIATKKKSVARKSGVAAVGFLSCVAAAVLWGNFSWMWALPPILFGGAIVFLILRWKPIPKHDALIQAINAYRRVHPLATLADGHRFKKDWTSEDLKQELFNYAPERMLIVQTDDVVDMLVGNKFHFETKTVVVSASKYPEHVFKACQTFLRKSPDLKIFVLHDASRDGLRLKEKLKADPAWCLQDRDLTDLGLSPEDIKNVKEPIWMPTRGGASAAPAHATVEEKINHGMRFPVDFVPPAAMIGILGTAVVAGLMFMSPELLAAQATKTGTDSSGGFG